MGTTPLQSLHSSQISQEQLAVHSKSVWTHREDYLYYSSNMHFDYDHYFANQLQLDIAHPAVQRYFEKLKMMEKYLQNSNLYLPLMCVAGRMDECSCRTESTINVNFYYEPFEIKLSNEVVARRQMGEAFKEAQLWFILYNLINAVRRFEPFCQKSGRISLEEVLLNSKGQIRLKCILSAPITQDESLQSLLAPEELQAMQVYFGRQISFNRYLYKQININPNICQTFSLGVLMLSLTQGCSPETFYMGMQVNGRMIGEALRRMAARGYSRLLNNLLTAMLSGYRYRPLPSQIYEVFSQYQQHILHFIPFRLRPDLKASVINIL